VPQSSQDNRSVSQGDHGGHKNRCHLIDKAVVLAAFEPCACSTRRMIGPVVVRGLHVSPDLDHALFVDRRADHLVAIVRVHRQLSPVISSGRYSILRQPTIDRNLLTGRTMITSPTCTRSTVFGLDTSRITRAGFCAHTHQLLDCFAGAAFARTSSSLRAQQG